MLIHWLANLSLIPFAISSMDSRANNAGDSIHLVTRIVMVCKRHLADTGPTREAAAVCISSLLTRPDMESSHLTEFMAWSMSLLNQWAVQPSADRSALTIQYFEVLGVLQSVFRIFKLGHRLKLLPFCQPLLVYCSGLCHVTSQTAARKLLTKLVQRIGMNFLPPRVASWRYMRGNRSLNLRSNGPTGPAPIADDSQAGWGSSEGSVDESSVSLELEEVLDSLLCSMRDKDTVVRWSAAKGIGRIAMRLSRDHAGDVVDAVLESFSEEGADCSWHGGCLTLAELARRGLLLPDRLAVAIPFITRAIHFDVLRGQHSVGAHVRDAACYVCWAFSRAYSPSVMAPFIGHLTTALLITALFDREVNCRRAASAAYQETVGRQGAQSVPHGIEILTVADYMSVGNRANCFCSVAREVADLDEKLPAAFVNHLVGTTAQHWDREMRSLAGKALASLLPTHVDVVLSELPRLLAGCTSPHLRLRHGSIVALAEVVFAHARAGFQLSADHSSAVLGVVPAIEKARLYKIGGELMREAVCSLITSVARSRLSMPVKLQVAMVETLNENLRQPFAPIRAAAREALREFLFAHFSEGETPSERLQKLTVSKYVEGLQSETNVSVTRGYALAIGALPLRLLVQPAGRSDALIDALSQVCSPHHRVGAEYDAETSCNGVAALVEVAERLCDAGKLNPAQAQRCFSALLASVEDYNVDNRGDTGSWSRSLALKGLETLTYAILRYGQQPAQSNHVACSRGRATEIERLSAPGSAFVVQRVAYSPQSTGWYALSGSDEWVVQHSAGGPLIGVLADHDAGVAVALRNVARDRISDVVGAVLKQLAEKLDAVREIAGGVLLRLLRRTAPLAGSAAELELPDEDHIVGAVAHATGHDRSSMPPEQFESINWSHPAHVYPVVCSLLDSPSCFETVLAGLVVSVGGLTETTAKGSARSLLDYCDRCRASAPQKLFALANALVDLLHRSKRLDRVVVPTLKTLILLVENGVMDALPSSERLHVVVRLNAVLYAEMRGSTVPSKVRLAVELQVRLLSLCRCCTSAHRTGLLEALPYLTHKFPVVRKCKVEVMHFYLTLVIDRGSIFVWYSLRRTTLPALGGPDSGGGYWFRTSFWVTGSGRGSSSAPLLHFMGQREQS